MRPHRRARRALEGAPLRSRTVTPLPLSVLDLTPVPAGADGRRALENSVDLARAVEGWGYRRHWLAEHHNLPGIASSAPEILIGRIAAATTRIRVGAGGIMLPNHSPLHVAETFKVPRGAPPGAHRSRHRPRPRHRPAHGDGPAPVGRPAGADDFPAQLMDLVHLGGEGLPPDRPFHAIRAEPVDVPLPPLWMLGSSDYGARVAAALGTGFAFARHMNPRGAEEAMNLYRDAFRPSPALAEPRAILAVSAVCAGDADRARHLAMSLALGVVRMRAGRPGPLPTPEEAAAHDYSPHEQEQVRRYMRAQVLGDPAEVAERLRTLAEATRADEVMVMTGVHDHAARLESYERIAGALG